MTYIICSSYAIDFKANFILNFFQFMIFLDRLGKAMQMDEISQEIGLDLQTESLLVRAEQLARLETDKLVDKVKSAIDIMYFRCRSHVANVFSFVLCFFVVQIVCAYRTSQYLCSSYTTLPRIRRERSFHELPCLKEVSPRREQSALERNFTEFSGILLRRHSFRSSIGGSLT